MNKKIYEFDEFQVDLGQKQLRRNGQNISLQPKVFDVLAAFLEKHGELVSRGELMQKVWADTFVEETNLRFCIHGLRKSLGKNANGKDYIETVPKRGYRFTAEVHEKSSETVPPKNAESEILEKTPSPETINKTQSARRNWLIGISAFSIICLLILAPTLLRKNVELTKSAFGVNSLAVLPFTQIGDKEIDLQLGLADAMITNLSKIKQLKVLPIDSVQRFVGRDFDALKVGRELRTDAVLDGSYRFEGDYVRVTAKLLRVSDSGILWTETFTTKKSNILDLENSISLRAARLLSLKIAQAEEEQTLTAQKINPEAVQNYLSARQIWRNEEFFRRQEMTELFEKAIALEPKWALAYSGYAKALLPSDLSSVEWEKIEQMANKAIELDNSLAQPRAVLGEIYQWRDWDWEKAESEFKQAVALSPNFAPTHYYYSQFLRVERRFVEAHEEIKKAIELEPFSPIYHASLCQLFYFDKKTDQAIEACHYSQQLEPNFEWSRKLLFWLYTEKKMYVELGEIFLGKLSPEQKAQNSLAMAIKQKDLRIYWQDMIDQSLANPDKPANPITLAMHYLLIGEREKSLDYLEQAFEQRFKLLPQVNANPLFDAVRQEKRFIELLRKVGLQK